MTTLSARAMLDAAMPEAEWQAQVIEAAQRLGWRVYHTLDSRGSTPGFPDLVLCREAQGAGRPARLVFAELKRERGRLSPTQTAWLAVLRQSAEAYCWFPHDWPEVERILR